MKARESPFLALYSLVRAGGVCDELAIIFRYETVQGKGQQTLFQLKMLRGIDLRSTFTMQFSDIFSPSERWTGAILQDRDKWVSDYPPLQVIWRTPILVLTMEELAFKYECIIDDLLVDTSIKWKFDLFVSFEIVVDIDVPWLSSSGLDPAIGRMESHGLCDQAKDAIREQTTMARVLSSSVVMVRPVHCTANAVNHEINDLQGIDGLGKTVLF